jgi:hypothetical protein
VWCKITNFSEELAASIIGIEEISEDGGVGSSEIVTFST